MKNRIILTESNLHKIINNVVNKVIKENTQPHPKINGGNQQYARKNQLKSDIKNIPKYYQELVNNGETYVNWADKYFDEWLIENHPELDYDIKPCADYYERTKFFLKR